VEAHSGIRPSRHDVLTVFADLGVKTWEAKQSKSKRKKEGA
jgi:hypothetical protein